MAHNEPLARGAPSREPLRAMLRPPTMLDSNARMWDGPVWAAEGRRSAGVGWSATSTSIDREVQWWLMTENCRDMLLRHVEGTSSGQAVDIERPMLHVIVSSEGKRDLNRPPHTDARGPEAVRGGGCPMEKNIKK